MTPDHRSTSTLQQTAPRAWSRSTKNTSLVSKRSEPTSTDRKPYHANLHLSRRRSLDESQSPRSSAFLDQTGSRERSSPKSIIAAVAAWPVGNPTFLTFNMYSLPMHLRRWRARPTAEVPRWCGSDEAPSSTLFVSARRREGYRFLYCQKRAAWPCSHTHGSAFPSFCIAPSSARSDPRRAIS